MSIEKNWDRINEQSDDDLSSLLTPSAVTGLSSNNPLLKIRKNLLKNMAWAVSICAMYCAIVFYYRAWQLKTIFSIILILSLWTLYKTYQEYKKINTRISSVDSLLNELKRHERSITGWMLTQRRSWLIIYPFCAAGGFMLGGVITSGHSLESFMNKPLAVPTLIVLIILLVPSGYYLAGKLFQSGFGKHLEALRENIKEMEKEY